MTGRQHQRTPVLSAHEQLGFSMLGLLLLSLVAWHVALTITTALPFSGYPVTLKALFRADPLGLPEQYAPAHPAVTLVLFGVLVMGTLVGGYLLVGKIRARRGRKAAEGTSDRRDIRAAAGVAHARDKARYTRRASVAAGLNLDKAPVRDFGLQIGTCDAEPVILTLEDQVGIFGATGRGKTRYLMVGAALDAPGALVATSTKLRDLDAIVTARSRVGKVYVWDPMDISSYPDPMYWDPTAGASDPTVAIARGQAFAGGLSSATTEAGKFFQDAAGQIMTRLLMAAAIGSHNMRDVVAWAADMDASGTKAVKVLKADVASRIWGQTLHSSISGDPRTVANTKMTMSMKIQPMLAPVVIRQMIPTPGAAEFDPASFVRSRDTLIMITDDNARASVASLSTMLLNEVIDAAKSAAAVAEADVLDPPLRIVGDEIANVAPLPKLPSMLSDSRGLGLQWVIAVQSLAQLTSRWGREDAEQILSNLNATIVLGGLLDRDALQRFSDLCGTAELALVSSSVDANNVSSGHSVQTNERAVLRPEEIAQLRDGQALVLLRNIRPMIVDLVPYDQRPDGAQITQEKAAAALRRRQNVSHD